jgi:SAM-dependent methyltransferase
MDATTQPALDRQEAFWDARAADYHDPRAPGQREQLLRRIALLPEQARPAAGGRVLDIGTGTGAMALYAAELGAEVTALDVSGAMLRRLHEAAQGLPIATVRADWRFVDVDATGFRRAFDLVVSQMVPSLREPGDFARIDACSRGWCVFIGWGRERRDPWLEAVFADHGVAWDVPAGAPLAARQLRTLGQEVQPVYWRETWVRARSTAAAIRDAVDHLAVRGVSADEELLRARCAGVCDGGQLIDRCEVEVGLVAWQPARR